MLITLSLLSYRDPKVGTSILPTVLDVVGNTPLVRLDKIAKMEGLECELCKYQTHDSKSVVYILMLCSWKKAACSHSNACMH